MEYLEFLLAHGSPAGMGTAVFAIITAVVAMIGAVLGAIAALPPAQRALAPPPPEVLYADYIPIEHIEEDRYTIRCKHDTVMQTWRLTGLDHTGLSNAERDRLYRAREATLNALAMEAGNLELRFITVRERERGSAADAQRRLYGTDTVNTIVEKWNEAAGEDVYTNRHYLLTYAKDTPEGRKALEHAHAAITGALAAYDPKRLSAPEASGPDMEEGPEAPLAAWLAPASRPRMFTTTGAPLAEMLACDEMVVFGGGRMVFNGGGRSCEAAVLGVQALPDAFNEQLTLEIMRAPAELTVAHTLKPHDRAKEIITLQRQAKVAGDVAIGDGEGQKAQIQEANEIVQGTHEAGLNANVWTYNLTIVVYAPSREALERAVVPVERALTLAGATAVREGFAAEAAWWSVLPTFPEIARRWRFLTFPVATLCIPQTTTAGIAKHDWADHEIARFRSTEGGIFRFTFHCSGENEELGHMFIVAPAGAGETSLLCHLTAHVLTLPDAQCVLFDRDCGTEVFTAVAGGRYVRFEAMEDEDSDAALDAADLTAKLNPFQLDDTPANREFLTH